MKFEIQGNPDYGDVTVWLAPGECIRTEGGAMTRMSTHLQVRSRLIGGFFRSLFRKMFGGESMVAAEYTAPSEGEAVHEQSFVAFAPSVPGTVLHRKLNNDSSPETADEDE